MQALMETYKIILPNLSSKIIWFLFCSKKKREYFTFQIYFYFSLLTKVYINLKTMNFLKNEMLVLILWGEKNKRNWHSEKKLFKNCNFDFMMDYVVLKWKQKQLLRRENKRIFKILSGLLYLWIPMLLVLSSVM